MSAKRFERLRELFVRAEALPAAQRDAFLIQTCADDHSLHAEVMGLLKRVDVTSPLDAPPSTPQIPLPPPGPRWSAPEAAALETELPSEGENPSAADTPLAEFRLIELLGEGGMGAVYEAEQRSPRRRVALKLVRPGLASRAALRRFMQEADVLGQLEHPGIARIYASGHADFGSGPQPFFAMELVRGSTLTRYVRDRRLNHRARLELFVKVCDAVQYAHQQGIIHRDLKPANILVADSDGQPKVLDFGVARITGEGELERAATLQTQAGQIIGTPQYMSPEQAAGDVVQIDTRSDVYALGLIAYELLGEKLPYELAGQPLAQAVQIIARHEPPRLGAINPRFRGDVETIVGKAIAKEKDHRYDGAAALAAEVRRYLAFEAIAARPPTTWYQLSRFARRNRVLVSAMCAVFVALTIGVVLTTWQALRATHAERAIRGEQDRTKAEKQTAERRFTMAKSLADMFLIDTRLRVAGSDGKALSPDELARATTQLDLLAKGAGDDVAVLRSVAAGYTYLGNAQSQSYDPHHHQPPEAGQATQGALSCYLKSLEISRKLASRSHDADPFRLDEAITLGDLARLHAIRGEFDECAATNRLRLTRIVDLIASGHTSDMTETRLLEVAARGADLPDHSDERLKASTSGALRSRFAQYHADVGDAAVRAAQATASSLYIKTRLMDLAKRSYASAGNWLAHNGSNEEKELLEKSSRITAALDSTLVSAAGLDSASNSAASQPVDWEAAASDSRLRTLLMTMRRTNPGIGAIDILEDTADTAPMIDALKSVKGIEPARLAKLLALASLDLEEIDPKDLERARIGFRRALEIAEEANPFDVDTGYIRVLYSHALVSAEDFAAAEAIWRASIASCREHGMPGSPIALQSRDHLIVVLWATGRINEIESIARSTSMTPRSEVVGPSTDEDEAKNPFAAWLEARETYFGMRRNGDPVHRQLDRSAAIMARTILDGLSTPVNGTSVLPSRNAVDDGSAVVRGHR